MISISGLQEFRARLDALDLDLAIGRGLRAAAEQVAERVRDSLSTLPGGPHAAPWLRTGGLRDSVAINVDGSGAVIGSTSIVAMAQEVGTRKIPPRPFLASTATEAAEAAALRIADAIAESARMGENIA